MKPQNLVGPALDWAVAKCEGYKYYRFDGIYGRIKTGQHFNASTDWAQGGPIIEREGIAIQRKIIFGTIQYQWKAYIPYQHAYGPTPLIAAMRCYVASKLGDEVEIPKELQ